MGVCMRNYNGPNFADILSSNVPDNASVVIVVDASGGCELSDMASQLRNNADSQKGKVLHLYVVIGKALIYTNIKLNFFTMKV